MEKKGLPFFSIDLESEMLYDRKSSETEKPTSERRRRPVGRECVVGFALFIFPLFCVEKTAEPMAGAFHQARGAFVLFIKHFLNARHFLPWDFGSSVAVHGFQIMTIDWLRATFFFFFVFLFFRQIYCHSARFCFSRRSTAAARTPIIRPA